MEVLVGPTFGIDAAYVRTNRGVAAQDKVVPAAAGGGLFVAEEESGLGGAQIGSVGGVGLRRGVDESSESSSSIGAPGESSENEEEEDDAVSSYGGLGGSFTSSLQDSLPIKRGLSNHYMGKSKSFGNLMEASSVKDLEKLENPFNKKRRLLIANKLRRRSGSLRSSSQFYAWKNPNSMPLLALQESDTEDDQEDDDDDSNDDERTKLQEEKKMKMMTQTQSCFCLSSLQEEEEGDDDDDQ